MAINDITREDAKALLDEQKFSDIIKPELTGSAALASFRNVTMSKKVARMPVLAALPSAKWVSESATDPTGVKPTTKLSWKDKELIAEEMACIVPIHENLIADSDYPIFDEIRPLVSQEFGRLLDQAVFFGTNKPTTWTDPGLVPGAVAAENVVQATGDWFDDFNNTFAKVENDDFDVNSIFTGKFMRANLRGLTNKNGTPIYLDNVRGDGATPSIFGENLYYTANRLWNREAAHALVGDASSVIIGIREDVQVKLLTEATLGTGADQLNLAERDMVALRFKFRVAYATAYSTLNAPDQAKAFPFAVLAPAAPGVGG